MKPFKEFVNEASNPTRDRVIEKIAKQILDVDTLRTRNNDKLDFHSLDVASIKGALEAGATWE